MIARTAVEEVPASLSLLADAELPALQHTQHRGRHAHGAQARPPARQRCAGDRHGASRQSRLVLVCGVAVCQERASGDGRGHRRFWRSRRHHALCLRTRRDARALLQRQLHRLARHFLRRHLLDPRRLDALSSEGRYMGAAAWGNYDRTDQSVLCAAAAILAARSRRPNFCRSRSLRIGRATDGALHQGADQNPRRADRA